MARPLRICEFGSAGPLRDRLVDAVLRGEKTATTSLLAEWESDGEPLPSPGERQTVVDSNGLPVGVIEFVAIDVVSLGDVGIQLALEEGVGFSDLRQWRTAHERYWAEEVVPRLSIGVALPLTDQTPVVVEHFRLVGEPLS
jgi:uncharacterized protein YhfF